MPAPGAGRLEALALAVELHASTHVIPAERAAQIVLATAGEFSRWLDARPARLRLRPAPFTFPQGLSGPGIPTRHTQGESMSVTMTDAQEVTYAVEAEDSKGVEVSDAITWSSDDGGAVVTVTPSADGMSCVFAAVAPGTATISATDGTLSASDLITVTPGAVASLVLTPGAPADEPSA